MLKRKPKKYRLEFTRTQLIHMRRFLNRACDCCEGRCPDFTIPAWYYIKPLLEKIEAAL